ncbi:unnamed protein product [Adineta ricciae]|uniref:Nicastrin n=1 Tax=Adineta ricciae TaxID=249248 RepID=A0A814HW53_ADIRI|nr:unnamed protein product [Adineta ricciae]
MYLTSSFDFCMRYLTKNTFTGCSSHPSGNRGRLIDISSIHDLTLHQHSQPIVILVLPRKDVLEYAIHSASMVVGILIDGGNNPLAEDGFTEVGTCPDDYIEPLKTSNCSIRKNKYGIDFREIKIEKPIFLLANQTFINELRRLYQLYNQQQVSQGQDVHVHMKSYAYGVENAHICDRRSKTNYFGEAYFKHYSIKCRSPMINIIWSTFNAVSLKNTRPIKSVIVFYTKFDFFSIFQPKNAGAQSTALGVITLLGLAWTLGRINLTQLLIADEQHKDVLFLFLNGDNWNYYGASEVNILIRKGKFPYIVKNISNENNLQPIRPEHIDILINIDQLGFDPTNTYILYNNLHPFLNKFKDASSSVTLKQLPSHPDSLADFQPLNLSSMAILTDAYENMNPYYNSYRDTLAHLASFSFIEPHIYALLKAICDYFKLSNCPTELSTEMKQGLSDRIQALVNCFLQSNCSNLIRQTAETGDFYFKEVSDQMKESFSFLQPNLHESEVKSYLNTHFLDASSYIHDILLNWIAIRTTNTTKLACEEPEDNYRWKIYQESTETCLRASINSINLIRHTNDQIDERVIFTSNYDPPELLVYMTSDTIRDIIMLVCGLTLSLCGFLLMYFLKQLLPPMLNRE